MIFLKVCKKIILAYLLIHTQLLVAQNTKNLLVLDSKTQKLQYLPYTTEGDIIPDFSYCGYRGGGVAIIKPNVVKILNPLVGDNTAQIQNAIDSIGQLEADKNGLRGALLLKPGKYDIAKTILFKYSGVTIMGEKDQARNTILVATTPKQYTLIKVGEPENPKVDKKSKRDVIADYVPSGTKVLLLNDASKFKVGDEILVERPSTQEWISFIGMDKIPENWRPVTELKPDELTKYANSDKLSDDKKKYDSTLQWAANSKNLKFERRIVAIEGNKVTIDIPLTNALQKKFGGGLVYKYQYTKRVSEVGIENLTTTSIYNDQIYSNDGFVGKYFSDENHGWNAIQFVNTENSWADNIEVSVFSTGFECGKNSRKITIQNSKVIDPICQIQGG